MLNDALALIVLSSPLWLPHFVVIAVGSFFLIIGKR